ncbi:MAG: peptidylprolyl isomerase, partial [Planctomycetales bacterium]|nr:peptidylprolyl isomerase [Planctomycetales bacterium]
MHRRFSVATLAACLAMFAGEKVASAESIVRFRTVMGTYDIQMFDEIMPRSVENFLNYVEADRYSGSVIHRNSDTSGRDFVIQGGGYFLFDPVSPSTVMSFDN